MLTPEKFREEYPPEELESELPDRPISSLRDIQHLYGRLYTLATAGGGEFAAYLTPNQANDLIGEEESLIAVRADLSGEEPQLGDPPIEVTQYTEDHVQQVCHCYFDGRGAGIDHSLTHRSGRDKDPERLGKYTADRLTRWPTEDAVAKVGEEADEGWIIEQLAELGERADALETIRKTVEEQLGGSRTAMITVKIRTEGSSDYQWPADLRVLNEAMRAQKLHKLVSKNEATNSAGEATDLITGTVGRTVGTAQDPLNYFLGKQMEKFPGLDPDEAWRSHPISEDSAVTLMKASEFVEACSYRTFNADVYYLPYFLGRPSPEETYKLYATLYGLTQDDEMDLLETFYEKFGEHIEDNDHRLRFYVSAVMKHQAARYDVFGETLNGSINHPVEVGIEHERITGSWVFDGEHQWNEERSPPMPSHDEWSLTRFDNLREMISSGQYLYETFPYTDEDTDASIEDKRIDVLVSILAGEPIPRTQLVGAYVERLLDWDGDGVPEYLVASQFAQLSALANAGLVSRSDTGRTDPAPIDGPDYDQTMTRKQPARADGGATTLGRSEKLESFIEETPSLEDPERRATFLLGALVGQVGTYQQGYLDRSTTVIDQYPIKSMTKTKIKRITQEVIDKDVVYSREIAKKGSNINTTMYEEITGALVDTMAESDPAEWEISTDDLRFYYALGVTYGMNDRTTNEPADTTETNE